MLGRNQLMSVDAAKDTRAADGQADRRRGLRIRYLEDNHAIVLAEHEVVAHQLAAHSLQQRSHGRPAIPRLVNKPADGLTRQRKEDDEPGHRCSPLPVRPPPTSAEPVNTRGSSAVQRYAFEVR